MGILNVTPDSFSDGGRYLDPQTAIEAGLRMLDEGADAIDVGGESTRPGSMAVSIEEETLRVIPVVEALLDRECRVSVDTSKPGLALASLLMGAWMINDVSAGRALGLSDHESQSEDWSSLPKLFAESGCQLCLMHMQGEPRTMQAQPTYGDVVQEVLEFLLARAKIAEAAGVPKDNIWIDPGIGFGKTAEHNLTLLKNLHVFTQSGYRVLIGVSRKSFLGKIASRDEPLPVEQRLEATLAIQTLAQAAGVHMIRAHDVRAARRAIDAAAAVNGSHIIGVPD